MRHCCRILLILAVTYPAMGCIATVNYAPNTHILREIGLLQGQSLLGEILTRTRAPLRPSRTSPAPGLVNGADVVLAEDGAARR